MSINPDDAFFNFKKIKLDWKRLSEADTRSKMIDKMFTGCLGWSESDITREPHVHEGFIDYVFDIDGMPRFVVETKKQGIFFEVPVSYQGIEFKLNGPISKNPTIMKAIEQAQDYCIEMGTPYGIISNGNQYIIFEAFIKGEKWRKGNCYVFKSLKAIEDNFYKFFDLLSRNAVRLNSLRKMLAGELGGLNYQRPLDRVHNNKVKLVRNHLANSLVPFTKFIFEEITDDSKVDILEKCYVFDKSYQETDSQIRSFFVDQLPPDSNIYKIENFVEGKDTAGRFQVNFYKCAEYLRKEEPEGSVSLLLGGIGSGKTTFLHRFFKVVLYPEEKVLWFYVDFRTAPSTLEDFRKFMVDKIVEEYEKKYSNRLKEELKGLDLERVDRTIEDLTKLVTILKILGYTISLVIDNVDQHYPLSPEIQHKVFLEAQYLTDVLKTVTILSLREESFFKSNLSGVFNAYYITKFHIVSPNFIDLVANRIDYLLETLELPEPEIKRKVKTRRDLGSRRIDELKQFFRIIESSFKDRRGRRKHITRFFESIAGGDMRRALELFNLFLLSGNTKVYEMLQIFNQTGNYQIAYHHVIKSIAFGESKYYSSKRSDIMNLFDINIENSTSHFLHLKILQHAKDRIQYDSRIERGYLSINKLKQEAEKILISEEAVEDSLIKLARFKLIVFDHQDPEGVKTASYYKITQTGIYYLEELSHRFVYLDLVWMDTSISDEKLEKELRYVIEERDLPIRFTRTENFLNYLKEAEEIDFDSNPVYYHSELGKYKFMSHIIRGYRNNKRYITDKLLRKRSHVES